MRASTSRLALTAVTLACLAGCGSGPSLKYAEVEGTVSIGGRAIPGVEVAFYPVSQGDEAVPASTAKTDANGKYRLLNAKGKPGAVIGKGRVVVNWPDRERSDDRDKAPRRPPFQIPVRYSVASQTPFLVEVTPGGVNTIDLALDPR